ncbi:LysR substrate-binding domain-containing protein [Micromonospora sp. WMMD882]|uniref:LysR family transcriptional regulator n=1 Tax=Micromonospora sp. WMMD882 TaxID=3015151 RepID=UPI00248B3229|nr:LysR substrate-binding domain-containing protein [Micromonospora sp. WMMD882]WBB78252.1 LysR substrate-binding domain-containing protein [Micromonospora sp. WMMD882]
MRYFTAVASHLHYGRAAAELHITQPSLSRQINQLEAQLGVRLLDRTRQGTRLTEAGLAFLPHAQALLRLSRQAKDSAQAADQPARVTIGYTPGLIITPAAQRLRQQHPDADVRTRHLQRHEPRDALLDERVDAAITRLPVRADGLRVTILFEEPRLLLVPVGHRLAGNEFATLDDIDNEPIPRSPDPEYDAFWRIDPRPGGRPAPDGPLVETIEDTLEHVAAGRAVVIIPPVGRSRGCRHDLVAVPLRGVEPCRVALLTRIAERNQLVAAFCAAARDCLVADPGHAAATDREHAAGPRAVH